MREGLDVIYQGTLFGGRWRGHPDFLIRVDKPSDIGPWSYEPADAKLAQRVGAWALLQLCVYADRLPALQGTPPEHVHVVTGDGTLHPHRLADYGAYYRAVKQRFEERVFGDGKSSDTYPDPVEHCSICRLVARPAPTAAATTTTFAAWPASHASRRSASWPRKCPRSPPLRPSPGRAQEGPRSPHARPTARAGTPAAGAVPRRPDPLRAHSSGPRRARPGTWPCCREPSPGDLFLDFESDPWATEDGLEFLVGTVSEADGAPVYNAVVVPTRAEEEKRAFEQLIDTIEARRATHPGAHVYHYGAYEATAIRRLMGRYATREDEVDGLLRGECARRPLPSRATGQSASRRSRTR